jgi:hypothetical protein
MMMSLALKDKTPRIVPTTQIVSYFEPNTPNLDSISNKLMAQQ